MEQREEVIINASDVRLGKLASQVATQLMGKDEADFEYHEDGGKKVVVYNTDIISVHPRKLKQKVYYWHTRYPGGIRSITLEDQLAKDSREVVRKAVYGMLPKNKLQDKMIQRLELHKGEVSK